MAVFYINGRETEVTKNQKLLRYLRDTLHLTSVKDGCSEGACGACTVLIDGEPIRACTPDTDSLEGRHILTVEGLTAELGPGDSFRFASRRPHRYRNPSPDRPTLVLWVNAVPRP